MKLTSRKEKIFQKLMLIAPAIIKDVQVMDQFKVELIKLGKKKKSNITLHNV